MTGLNLAEVNVALASATDCESQVALIAKAHLAIAQRDARLRRMRMAYPTRWKP